MSVEMVDQLRLAGGALMLGVAVGAYFEVLRLLGHIFGGAVVQFWQDFLFIVGITVASLWYFQHYADGQIRVYDVVLEIGGAVGFHMLLGRHLYRPLCKMLEWIKSKLCALLSLVLRPLKLILAMIGKCIKKLFKFLKNIFIFLKKYIIIFLSRTFAPKRKERNENSGKEKQDPPQDDGIRFYH